METTHEQRPASDDKERDAHYEGIDAAEKLLPAWFIPRMMDDVWHFGLLLVTGHVMAVGHIDRVRAGEDGTVWIDATMEHGAAWSHENLNFLEAPTSRLKVSVNASHVVAAFELADT